jgi:hypothetical protein
MTFPAGIQTVEVVDNGAAVLDTSGFGSTQVGGRAPTDCSPLTNPIFFTGAFLEGSVISIFDAPVLPTSKDQCKNGGWLNFPQFKNQGDCVSFVENGK